MQPLPIPTTKEEVLAQIHDEFNAFVALVEQIPDDRRLTPIAGSLSVKDIVAHISDWEAWMLMRIRSAAAGDMLPPRTMEGIHGAVTDIDGINAAVAERFKDAEWETVWDDLLRTHEESLMELAQMGERDLFDPLRVREVTGLSEGTGLELVIGNTSEHYREHSDELRAAFGL
ncbi:MAG: ClbS/DfsB family four-helix bundle protein [Caldilineaceae bacterium]